MLVQDTPKVQMDRHQHQINKLKQALAACIDVCAAQNKQLGLIAEASSSQVFPQKRWDVYAASITENGILADKLLLEV